MNHAPVTTDGNHKRAMRIIRHRLNNRIANAAVMVVICALLVGLIPIRTALAAGMEVNLPYQQTWTNDSGVKVSDTFDYRMTAADASSPMPAESSGGVYDFSLTGTTNGRKTLHFAFSKPGYYHYTVTPTTGDLSDRYVYKPPVYDVMIMVVNGSSGLQVGAMTIKDLVREQSGDNAKFEALEYDASYKYEAPVKPPGPKKKKTPAGTGIAWTPEPGTPVEPENGGTVNPPDIEPEPVEPDPGDPGIEPEGEDYWALLNLILMILTVIIAIIDGILYFRDPDDDDEEEEESGDSAGRPQTRDEEQAEDDESDVKKHGLIRILALIVAIISIIVFFLTEDMRLPMEWVDEYTIWMIILFVIEVILAFLSRKTEDDEDEEEGGGDGADDSVAGKAST